MKSFFTACSSHCFFAIPLLVFDIPRAACPIHFGISLPYQLDHCFEADAPLLVIHPNLNFIHRIQPLLHFYPLPGNPTWRSSPTAQDAARAPQKMNWGIRAWPRAARQEQRPRWVGLGPCGQRPGTDEKIYCSRPGGRKAGQKRGNSY